MTTLADRLADLGTRCQERRRQLEETPGALGVLAVVQADSLQEAVHLAAPLLGRSQMECEIDVGLLMACAVFRQLVEEAPFIDRQQLGSSGFWKRGGSQWWLREYGRLAPKPRSRWKHFRNGGLFEVVGLGVALKTGEVQIRYRHLDNGHVWDTSLYDWFETWDQGGGQRQPCFSPAEDAMPAEKPPEKAAAQPTRGKKP